MGSLVRALTAPFSQWAERIKAQSSVNSHPVFPQAFIDSCYGFLEAMDGFHFGKECAIDLLSDGTYQTLGEATAADWQGISEGLARRAGTHAHSPAWLQEDPQESRESVRERIRRARCSSEVAVLMLRLAMRAASLTESWYGPWDNQGALQQLTRAGAWASLLEAQHALLATFGPDLDIEYNAINIVCDILHVRRAPCFLATSWVAWSSTETLKCPPALTGEGVCVCLRRYSSA